MSTGGLVTAPRLDSQARPISRADLQGRPIDVPDRQCTHHPQRRQKQPEADLLDSRSSSPIGRQYVHAYGFHAINFRESRSRAGKIRFSKALPIIENTRQCRGCNNFAREIAHGSNAERNANGADLMASRCPKLPSTIDECVVFLAKITSVRRRWTIDRQSLIFCTQIHLKSSLTESLPGIQVG